MDKEDFELAEKIPYVVFAIAKTIVGARFKLAKKIGLKKPEIIEPNAAALASIYYNCNAIPKDSLSVFVDIANGVSLFTVMGKKSIMFSRPMNACADRDLLDQISRDLGVDNKKAEELKMNYFKLENVESEDQRLKNTISHFFTKLAIEVQRSIDNFTLMFKKSSISKVFICGNGAYYKGFDDYLGKTVGLTVLKFDPFECIDTSEYSAEDLGEKKSLFTVAAGLAID